MAWNDTTCKEYDCKIKRYERWAMGKYRTIGTITQTSRSTAKHEYARSGQFFTSHTQDVNGVRCRKIFHLGQLFSGISIHGARQMC